MNTRAITQNKKVVTFGEVMPVSYTHLFDHADNAFVSAFRFYKDDEHRIVDVHIEYIAAPSLNDTGYYESFLARGERCCRRTGSSLEFSHVFP